ESPGGSAQLGGDGILRVTGSNAPDLIHVVVKVVVDNGPPFTVLANVNGIRQSFSGTAVKGILINALGGNDTVTADGYNDGAYGYGSPYINTTMLGGDGNDSLEAAVQDSNQRGDGPSDSLNGGAGDDTLSIDHDSSSATLVGGDGNDLFETNGDYGLLVDIY